MAREDSEMGSDKGTEGMDLLFLTLQLALLTSKSHHGEERIVEAGGKVLTASDILEA